MSLLFEVWLDRYRKLQQALEEGSRGNIWPDLAQLEIDAKDLAREGLDIAEFARCLLAVSRAQLHLQERDREKCIADLREAEPRFSLRLPQASLAAGNRSMIWGNLRLMERDYGEALQYFSEAAHAALRAGSPDLLGNAMFNAGICLSCLGRLSEAKKRFSDAHTAYEAAKRPAKVAQSLHMIGNTAYAEGSADEAFFFLQQASNYFMHTKDYASCCMITDDMSRIIGQKAASFSDPDESAVFLKQAFDFAFMAAWFGDRVWEGYLDNPRLHADLSERLVNQSVTFCELALANGHTILFLGELARCKGRLRNFKQPAPPIGDNQAQPDFGVAQRMGSALVESVAESIRSLGLVDGSVAVCDQIAVTNGSVISGVVRPVGGKMSIGWFESEREPVPPKPETARALRGENRSRQIIRLANDYLRTVNEHGNRCSYIAGDLESALSVGDRAQIEEWSDELDAIALDLGESLFSGNMIQSFQKSGVEHVILVPDPSLPLLPYHALKTKDGYLVDQPWTMSIATSMLDIPRCIERLRAANAEPGAIVWMAPDRDVNENRGGFIERDAIAKHFKVREFLDGDATIAAARNSLERGSWLHIRSHGRWTGDIASSGAVLADGVLSETALTGLNPTGASFLITSACRTCVSEGVGLENLGSVVHYDQFGLLGSLLSAWPVHGVATTRFMDQFYTHLARGASMATAQKEAAKAIRSALIHPYFWAPFVLLGSWESQRILAEPSS